mmetsp:Transcript_2389/g.8400  ORF Transcript_2389/g.8400 Transcript_2389/m.8400 type:complete len:311 (-) Transcript_2389:164-1096(-)
MILVVVLALLALPTVLWLLSYLPFVIATAVLPPVDLKKKYGATWALVTGAGTGIGRSLATKLAQRGLNVVLVSLPDEHLEATTAALREAYPRQQFVSVGVNFARGVDYMTPIIEATNGIPIQAVFNNAGYIVTGFFEQEPLPKQLSNVECNAVAAVQITHHFVGKMTSQNLKGCVVFTSSVSGYIPNPFACMYGATKAFISQFAASLSVEVGPMGIDVLAVHPSPVASNFYDNAKKLDALEMAKKAAVSPDKLPDDILRCVGRTILGDLGGMAVGVRTGIAPVSYNLLSTVFTVAAPYLPDYQRYRSKRS